MQLPRVRAIGTPKRARGVATSRSQTAAMASPPPTAGRRPRPSSGHRSAERAGRGPPPCGARTRRRRGPVRNSTNWRMSVPGDEGLTRAADDHDADAGSAAIPRAHRRQLLVHRPGHRVARRGMTELTCSDRPVATQPHLPGRRGRSRPSCVTARHRRRSRISSVCWPSSGGGRRTCWRRPAELAAARPSTGIRPSTGWSISIDHAAGLDVRVLARGACGSPGSGRPGPRPRAAGPPRSRCRPRPRPLLEGGDQLGAVRHPVGVGAEARVVEQLLGADDVAHSRRHSRSLLAPTVT